ncbi:CRISPR-associated RAMP protein [Sulfodiicoccus acidiphilus]|uniref:CRISPR-associated RAMP protein n=1 Tax=Sulfodiicoccus acidiphilus TaxID=1670455 RepID=A0A348B5C1_9CREN|nr:CRISPR-associated RAMP protein Csx7 [Sulfodiicoccus acidiphilus]BBD73373.1 CRISPR-associated RAMP protein [Sulfodiicoccus acidiphilus]GGU00984.1 CRISPR-associated RAMP protein [Sulfodiicoccus acidiphilus]
MARNSNHPCYDLNAMRNLLRVEGYLVNETPLRVGSGRSQSFQDRTDFPLVARGGRPYIPGSSLKGVLRSSLEAYVLGSDWPDKFRKVLYVRDDGESCVKDEKGNKEEYCIPCILFGFKDLASRVSIMDAVPEGDVRVVLRTGVTINRVFGGQQPGNLYNLDYVDSGSKFRFRMTAQNVLGGQEEWTRKVEEGFKYVLGLLKDGFFVGGRRSTGAGFVRLSDAKVRIYEVRGGKLFARSEGGLEVVA